MKDKIREVMHTIDKKTISVGARASLLSQKQVEEVEREIKAVYPGIFFTPQWLDTMGDRDKKTPLWKVYKSDFFTKEIDELQLQGQFRITIHSAKDVPHPLRDGLEIIAITRGVDTRDCLVLPEGKTVETLPYPARIGTSSKRREEALRNLRADLIAVDIRGTIQERLSLLENGSIDALIMAEAALIRLGLTHLHRIYLEAEPEPLQGKLAVIARTDDTEMKEIFSAIDSRIG